MGWTTTVFKSIGVSADFNTPYYTIYVITLLLETQANQCALNGNRVPRGVQVHCTRFQNGIMSAIISAWYGKGHYKGACKCSRNLQCYRCLENQERYFFF